MAYDSVDGEFRSYYSENIPDSFHGTGDVFAAVLFGALVLGKDIAAAMKLAVDFTVASIRATVGDSGHRYGEGIARAHAELGELTAAHRHFNAVFRLTISADILIIPFGKCRRARRLHMQADAEVFF